MTFDQLETLEMIVEKGSFKAASEHLNKTQPSLSVAIRKLEEEFDVQLFNREEYRPKLTEQGLVFYNWAKNCLQTFRQLQTVGKELGTYKAEPFLNVVVDPLVRFEAIEGIFSETLLSQHPTELTLRSEIMNVGMEMLLSGEMDFAIAPKMREHEEIESVEFDKVEMIPVVARSLIKSATMNLKWLQQQPQIVVLSGIKDHFLKRESKGLHSGGKRCFVSDHTMKYKLIMNGFGWGRLASHEVNAEVKRGQLLVIKEESIQPFTLDLQVMRLKNKPMGPVARAVWAQLIKNVDAKKAKKSKATRKKIKYDRETKKTF